VGTHHARNKLTISDLLHTLNQTTFDTMKWSRRGTGTGGKQNKIARHNACYTDLHEPLKLTPDVEDDFVRRKHPKNPLVKFTNLSFKGQFAELNKVLQCAMCELLSQGGSSNSTVLQGQQVTVINITQTVIH
jgi:hypothetical protein